MIPTEIDTEPRICPIFEKIAAYPFPFVNLCGIQCEQNSASALGSCTQRSTIPTRTAENATHRRSPPDRRTVESTAGTKLALELFDIEGQQGGLDYVGHTHPPLPSCPSNLHICSR